MLLACMMMLPFTWKVKSEIYILKFYQPDIRAKFIMQMVAISESNIQEKLSSHELILSNAYNETTDFYSMNAEENPFGAINPENRM